MDSHYIVPEFPGGHGAAKSLSETFIEGVRRKNRIIVQNPNRRGSLHMVGLVIDEVHAHSGATLVNTLLGGLVYAASEGRHYRGVPQGCQTLYREAQARGRQDLLDVAQYDPQEVPPRTEGVFFDPATSQEIDGVVALYYTNELHFVPNPFSPRDITALMRLFPMNLRPFRVSADG